MYRYPNTVIRYGIDTVIKIVKYIFIAVDVCHQTVPMAPSCRRLYTGTAAAPGDLIGEVLITSLLQSPCKAGANGNPIPHPKTRPLSV